MRIEKSSPIIDQTQLEQVCERASESGYEVESIRLDTLQYRWMAPHFNASTRTRGLSIYEEIEKSLREHSKSPRAEHAEKIKRSIFLKGMLNPLIVKKIGGAHFVVLGNQRLAILRSLSKEEKHRVLGVGHKVRCIVAKDEDDWSDRTPAVRFYLLADGFHHPQAG